MCTTFSLALAICVLASLAGQQVSAIERPRDELVLNAIIVHFLADFSEEIGYFAEKRQKVVLHNRNPETTGLLDQTLNLARHRNGHSEAIEDVLRRNRGVGHQSKPVSYEKFQLDKRIEIGSIGSRNDLWDFEEFKGFLEFHAPGYSKDGRTAVVMGYCWPSAHPTGMVYYLKLDEGGWIVKWRALIWYN